MQNKKSMNIFNSEVISPTLERSSVPVEHTWNLADIFPDEEAWLAAKTSLVAKFEEVDQFKGRVTASAADLHRCLEFNSNLAKIFSRLYSYAAMRSDEDTRDSRFMGMRQEIGQVGTEYRARAAFIEPELLTLDEEKILSYIQECPYLEPYRMYLFDLQRRKTHKLTEPEERILANAGLVTDGPYSVFSILSNAEMPYPEATLSDGSKVKLNQAGYARYRQVLNRDDRETVFQIFWTTMNQFKGTFGAQLYSNVNKDIFYARSRHYPSSLAAALDVDNIPEAVYRTLIANANAYLDAFHRYLKIRRRMLDLDQLKYSDLYAPVVKGVDLDYDIDAAQGLILDALRPMGEEYMTAVLKAMNSRWIDVYPTPGKRSGAYMSDGGYEVHPYILLNFNGKYTDVSTLAHEMGHAMHTYFSNKTQPFPLADYSIFVAEVASTFNEALLTHHMLDTVQDDDVRLSILMEYLDGIKGTVFRQTQFAEYEVRIHETAERGEALTGDVLTKLYSEVVKKYYGHEEGICHIDDLYTVEWTYIPHFYYNFYVYQYATSFTASTALSSEVLEGVPGAVERYLQFISSGGSDYPINLLKTAGVDMTTSTPFERTMAEMNRVMDEIEGILEKRGGEESF